MERKTRGNQLTQKELEYYTDHLSEVESLSDPYSTDEDPEYQPNEPENQNNIQNMSDSSDSSDDESNNNISNKSEKLSESSGNKSNINRTEKEGTNVNVSRIAPIPVIWTQINDAFVPRKKIPDQRQPLLLADLNRGSSEYEVFLHLFPKSLFLHIASCTNIRLDILEKTTKKTYPKTDCYEIMVLFGCMMVMSYNRVPSLPMYWSQNLSLGNPSIKSAISRDRFLLLTSKLYFANPEKPENSSKAYYVEDLISCLTQRYQKARSDSPFQSIDETMTKFKGRSSLKQYLPLKPIKRGIKLWQRCDAETGYVYDLSVYTGKEMNIEEQSGTLGERVVRKLCETIRNKDVAICCDRFFTSVEMVNTLEFACVGTCIKTRRNVPRFEEKLERGESRILCNNFGSVAMKWQDTKEVIVLSNCHKDQLTEVSRTAKDGTKKMVSCPEALKFYNCYMGGVDLADQFSSLYDPNRKSNKWWKKVFQKLLMTTAANAWIIHQELHHKKTSFIEFLVVLAESLIGHGKEKATVQRKRTSGRPSKRLKMMLNIGDHLPQEGNSRRRCSYCSQKNIEQRTKTLCVACNIPLCKNCFLDYHKQ